MSKTFAFLDNYRRVKDVFYPKRRARRIIRVALPIALPPPPEPEPVTLDPERITESIKRYKAEHPEQFTIYWRDLRKMVAKRNGLTVDELMSDSRTPSILHARFELYYVLRSELRMSYPHIGQLFKRDHTTILNGVRKYCKANNLPVPPGRVNQN